jgi:hypothetical protein
MLPRFMHLKTSMVEGVIMKDQKNIAGMGISVIVTRSITQMIKCELQRKSSVSQKR